jgi:hypothetical protein
MIASFIFPPGVDDLLGKYGNRMEHLTTFLTQCEKNHTELHEEPTYVGDLAQGSSNLEI